MERSKETDPKPWRDIPTKVINYLLAPGDYASHPSPSEDRQP
jgi:hypothetical protein